MIKSVEFLFKANVITNSAEHSKLLRTASMICDLLTKIIIGLYVLFVGLCYFGYPLVLYVVYGELELILPVYIPGIDETSTTGFIITTVFHVTAVTLAVNAYAAIDSACLITILGAVFHGLLIKIDANLLNDELRNRSADRISVKARFRNILMMQRDMAMYGNVDHRQFYVLSNQIEIEN